MALLFCFFFVFLMDVCTQKEFLKLVRKSDEVRKRQLCWFFSLWVTKNPELVTHPAFVLSYDSHRTTTRNPTLHHCESELKAGSQVSRHHDNSCPWHMFTEDPDSSSLLHLSGQLVQSSWSPAKNGKVKPLHLHFPATSSIPTLNPRVTIRDIRNIGFLNGSEPWCETKKSRGGSCQRTTSPQPYPSIKFDNDVEFVDLRLPSLQLILQPMSPTRNTSIQEQFLIQPKMFAEVL